MTLNSQLSFLFIILMLQACSGIKKPYSTILQSPPEIIKTSVGNVEVWKWEPPLNSASMTKGVAYLIPGFPGSSLENAPLARQLLRKGYSVRLVNPPGHGQSAVDNTNWSYKFPQYGHALYESIRALETRSPDNNKHIIIAHSAGAEMVLKMLLLRAKTGDSTKQYNIVLINPWLPSISNHPIPWTTDDEDILKYSPSLVRLFGPISKGDTHRRLFSNPSHKQNIEYLCAHEKLTEDLDGWGAFDSRFARLLISTTRTQKNVLQQGTNYELSPDEIIQLRRTLRLARVNLLVINSSASNDKIIPKDYKIALEKKLKSKLPGININSVELLNGGHMLQVEQPKRVIDAVSDLNAIKDIN